MTGDFFILDCYKRASIKLNACRSRFQYNKRVRSAAEERAQTVPGEGAAAAAQGEVPVAVPRAARLLRGAVPGEGRHAHRARRARPAQVLAEDLLAEGGAYFYL